MEGDEPQVSADEFEALADALEADEAEAAPDTPAADTPAPEVNDGLGAEHALEPGHHHEHGAELLSGDPGFVDPEMSLLTFFNSWDLFGDSAMAGAVAGGLLGFLGVYVVLRRMVFLSAALSQTASLGIVVAFFLQISLGVGFISPLLGALIATFTAIVALTLGVSPERRDSMLGFVFLLGSSGTILLGTRIVQEIQDVQTLLFGTAVAVVPGDFKLLVGIAVVIGALHLAGWRGFVAVVFDSEDARVRGSVSFGGGCVVHPSASLLALSGPLVLGESNVFDERATLVNAPSIRLMQDDDEGCCDGAAAAAAVESASSAAPDEGGAGAANTVGHGNLFEARFSWQGPKMELRRSFAHVQVGCCVAAAEIGDYNVFGARAVVEVGRARGIDRVATVHDCPARAGSDRALAELACHLKRWQ